MKEVAVLMANAQIAAQIIIKAMRIEAFFIELGPSVMAVDEKIPVLLRCMNTTRETQCHTADGNARSAWGIGGR